MSTVRVLGMGPFALPAVNAAAQHPIDAPIGHGDVTLARLSAKRLRVSVNGAAGPFEGQFTAEFEIDLSVDPVRFERYIRGDFETTPPIMLTVPVTDGRWSAQIGACAVDGQAFDFVVTELEFHDGLGAHLRTAEIFRHSMRWWPDGAALYLLRIDALGRRWSWRRDAATTGSAAEIFARLDNAMEEGGRHVQNVRVDEIAFDLTDPANAVVMKLAPVEKVLAIVPEFLTLHEKSGAKNPVMHQMTLADGVIEVRHVTAAGPGFHFKSTWKGTQGGKASLLLHALRDENAFPVCVEVDEVPLIERDGTTTTNPNQNVTSVAIVLDASRWEAKPRPLRTIEVRRSAMVGEPVPAKWLGDDGRLPLLQRPPREVHGFSANAFLCLAQDAQAALTLQDSVEGGGVRFQCASLDVVGASVLTSIYAEREYRPSAIAAAPALEAVGARKSVSALNVVRLPATDFRVAVANLNDADDKPIALVREAAEWFRALDQELVSQAFTQFTGECQQHVEGFRLLKQGPRTAETLLGRLGQSATELAQVEVPAPEMQHAVDDFVFGVAEEVLPNDLVGAIGAHDVAWKALLAYWDAHSDLAGEVIAQLNQLRDRLLEKVEERIAPVVTAVRVLQVVSRFPAAALTELLGLQTRFLTERSAFDATLKNIASNPGAVQAAVGKLIWIVARVQQAVAEGRSITAEIPAAWPPEGTEFPAASETLHRLCLAVIRVVNRACADAAWQADVWPALEQLWNVRNNLSGTDAVGKVIDAWLESAQQPDQSKWRSPLLTNAQFGAWFAKAKKAAAWALPLTRDLFDRMARSIGDSGGTVGSALRAALALSDHLVYPQFRQAVLQGWDEWRQKLKAEYEGGRLDLWLNGLRKRVLSFGEVALDGILELSVAARGEVAVAIGLSRSAGELLHLLRSKPPAYVVVSKAFESGIDSPAEGDDLLAMWQRRFRLCGIGSRAWDFHLDGSTTVILKLSPEVRIEDVLRELQQKYARAAGTADPLRLWSPELRAKELGAIDAPPAGDRPDYSALLAQAWTEAFVDPDVARAQWRGIFVVNPVADLTRDEATSKLCGLHLLPARYVAIGGKQPGLAEKEPSLDIYATILAAADPLANAKVGKTDATLALVRFDARIRNTRLRGNTSIELRLDLDRLLGRSGESPGGLPTGYQGIRIFGSLRPPSNADETEHLEFAAVFERPLELPVGIAFIDKIVLRQVRAGNRAGHPTLELDADLEFREADLGAFHFDSEEPGGISLKDFRLLSPAEESTESVAMGTRRPWSFDLGSVEFRLRKSRTFSLGVLDLTITRMGYVRRREGVGQDDGYDALKRRMVRLVGSVDAKGDLPYFVFDVDFGKLPKLGIVSASSLKLELLAGVDVAEGGSLKPVLGLIGASGTEVVLDLFRVLTVKIEQLYFVGGVPSVNSGNVEVGKVSLLGSEQVSLSILGKEIIGGEERKAGLNLLMAQDPRGRSGFLLSYVNEPDPKALVGVHWILLGRGLELRADVLTALLTGDDPDLIKRTLTGVVEKIDNGVGKPPTIQSLRATLLPKGDWLFGIYFQIGSLLPECRLILQDGHYYGIRLRADWLKPLIDGGTVALAYIPGPTARQDRFLVELPFPRLDLFGPMRAGWLTLSWAFNNDFLVGLGFPWRIGRTYAWDRSFSFFVGIFEAKFGFYISKTTVAVAGNDNCLRYGAGIAFYLGYGFAAGNSVAYIRAGIGVFAVVEGSLTFSVDNAVGPIPLRGSIVGMSLTGALGIYAYCEGGIDIWIISARFRAYVQASLMVGLEMRKGSPATLTYSASLTAGYEASVRVGAGFFSFTFSVSGSFEIGVSGQLLLN